jgi:CheY-like chemotaxis protein
MQERILHILLVEDDPVNQKVASSTLKRQGYIVDIAENGRIGVELFKQNYYDIILMDIQMPEMDGIEATKIIRQLEIDEGRNIQIPIIAVTAYAMEKDKNTFLSAGMDNYLSKPYKPENLLSLINSTLEY